MIVYQQTKAQFINECRSDTIADSVANTMRLRGINSFDKPEIRSWKKSLPAIADVLAQTDTDDDIDVAIEYKINQSRDRIDFMIYGNDVNGKKNLIIL